MYLLILFTVKMNKEKSFFFSRSILFDYLMNLAISLPLFLIGCLGDKYTDVRVSFTFSLEFFREKKNLCIFPESFVKYKVSNKKCHRIS